MRFTQRTLLGRKDAHPGNGRAALQEENSHLTPRQEHSVTGWARPVILQEIQGRVHHQGGPCRVDPGHPESPWLCPPAPQSLQAAIHPGHMTAGGPREAMWPRTLTKVRVTGQQHAEGALSRASEDTSSPPRLGAGRVLRAGAKHTHQGTQPGHTAKLPSDPWPHLNSF